MNRTTREPLFRVADMMPLGRVLGTIDDPTADPGCPDARPFGLGFATSVRTPLMVDLSTVRYDPDRQVSVDKAGSPVFGKHSTGQTNTKTSDGHKAMDSDTDHTED